jgi:hypothetical protein
VWQKKKQSSTIISSLTFLIVSRSFVHIHYRARASLTREHDDDDYEWENEDENLQKQEDMPAIIVNEVQVSPKQTLEDSRNSQDHENNVNGEFLEAKESRRNELGLTRDNDDEELGMSYNNFALPPRGVLQFAPYPLMNQQQVLFQPNNQPLRVAALQSK